MDPTLLQHCMSSLFVFASLRSKTGEFDLFCLCSRDQQKQTCSALTSLEISEAPGRKMRIAFAALSGC